mgnify:CR=1 FL=1
MEKTILIVEDDSNIRELLSLYLEQEGYHIEMAQDGADGLRAFKRVHPDLVLLYDTQYPVRYTAIDGLVPAAQVIALETAVVGQGSPTDWLDAMGRNIEKLQKLTGGDTP